MLNIKGFLSDLFAPKHTVHTVIHEIAAEIELVKSFSESVSAKADSLKAEQNTKLADAVLAVSASLLMQQGVNFRNITDYWLSESEKKFSGIIAPETLTEARQVIQTVSQGLNNPQI